MRWLVGVCLALTATAASAQYRDDPAPAAGFREGDAEVLRPLPPPPSAGQAAAGNFRAAYARARQPRILVFWNRAFSDEVSSTYRQSLRAEAGTDVSSSARVEHQAGWGGSLTTADTRGSSRSTLDASVGAEREERLRDNPLDESDDFAVEAAFSATLATNGAQLIDRSLAMRTSRGARGAGSQPNMQAIETEAATGRANLLIEVLQAPAPGTAVGVVFKVTVKDIRGARLLAAFTSTGRAPPVRARLVAGPGGFVRAAPPVQGPDGVGRELANQTMAAMARALR